jgi:hypothetical protein
VLHRIIKEQLNQVYEGSSNATICDATSNVGYGLGRYAAERWIAGHFGLKPCEVFPSNRSVNEFVSGLEPWTSLLEMSRKTNARMTQQESTLELLMQEYVTVHGWYTSADELPDIYNLYFETAKESL